MPHPRITTPPKAQLSMLPWGGPFMWSPNEHGNLELVKISDATDAMQRVIDALEKRVTL